MASPPERIRVPARPSVVRLRGAGRGAPTAPRSIVELLDQRVLDPELAALIWLLLEAHAPLLVAGAPGSGKTTLLDAALDLLPPLARTVPLEGAIEDFAWLPEAPELGWRPPRRLPGAMATERPRAASPESTVLLLSELSTATERDTWGPRARIAVRALSLGYAMAATIPAERLEEVFERLRRPPVMLTDDELSRLGVVIVIREVAPPRGGEARRRVVAAHYVRPVVRDAHGHVQRMAPAVLAAYESRTDELEHFAWGIVPELAIRVGRSASDFEREQARRAEFLQGLVATGVTDPSAVRLALANYLGCDPAEVD